MKILIYYHHGLGDCILLTPQLRYFYKKYNAQIDLLCRKSVIKSHLFDDCPYLNDMIIIKNPWDYNFKNQLKKNYKIFKEMTKKYDKSFFIDHVNLNKKWNKVYNNSLACRIFEQIDTHPEIFINKGIKKRADKYIAENFPNGYIFQHTNIEYHKIHSWNSKNWIENNLSNLPVFDSSKINNKDTIFRNINFTFYLLSKADYVVLSSSVMVHAADALKKTIDLLHYGKPDYYNLPVNKEIVKRLHVENKFIDIDKAYSSLKNPEKIERKHFILDKINNYITKLKKYLILIKN